MYCTVISVKYGSVNNQLIISLAHLTKNYDLYVKNRIFGHMDSPVFFPTRIGERASASHAHCMVGHFEH